MSTFHLACLLGVMFVFIFMIFLWVLQLKTKNAGVVDLGWTLSLVVLVVSYAVAAPGAFQRKFLIVGMVLCWGLRLASHIYRRIQKEVHEDHRYQSMRQALGNKAPFFFLLFFLFQAVVAVAISLPFYLASKNPDPKLYPVEVIALILWGIAFTGETIADAQLRGFKHDPANRGKVCEVGLWNYSRHPNYFFECLIWISYFLVALASPGGIYALVSPVLMIFFIVKVSGVPPAEAQSLASRGEAYRRYQASTSVLIPWFKKNKV